MDWKADQKKQEVPDNSYILPPVMLASKRSSTSRELRGDQKREIERKRPLLFVVGRAGAHIVKPLPGAPCVIDADFLGRSEEPGPRSSGDSSRGEQSRGRTSAGLAALVPSTSGRKDRCTKLVATPVSDCGRPSSPHLRALLFRTSP